jgi:DNA-binding HxlR family transcriptional regulator
MINHKALMERLGALDRSPEGSRLLDRLIRERLRRNQHALLLLLHWLHIHGPTRFGELKRRLGAISTKTLTERLRMLEAEGWVTRDYKPTVPPQVTYAITKRVLELDGVMTELDRIAERWYGKGGRPLPI